MPKVSRLILSVTFLIFLVPLSAMAQSYSSGTEIPFSSVRGDYSKPSEISAPEDNPTTPEKVLLGKILFFDPRLSGTNSMSCASCHNPDLGWSDGLPKALGAGGKFLNRHTPSLFNVGMSHKFQWDGEFRELEQQALGPIRKKTEMNQDLKSLPRELKAIKGYAPLFERAFPGQEITIETIAKALAAFQRTILSEGSPFEAFLSGDDNAMSIDAKMGLMLFREKAGCQLCHSGFRFSDDSFYDIGLKSTDKGAGAISKQKYEDYKFKNQKLLDIAKHPPYMHDGSLPDLSSVIEFYMRGGDSHRPSLSSDIKVRNLNRLEKAQLLAFLKALSSPSKPFERPTLPE